eukprot:6486235-Amphidinium_carterae.1
MPPKGPKMDSKRSREGEIWWFPEHVRQHHPPPRSEKKEQKHTRTFDLNGTDTATGGIFSKQC